MKKLFFLVTIIVLFSGCAMHNSLMKNVNTNSTEVVLAKKNFKVVARVRGEASAKYFFGIGGFSRNALVDKARADMLSKVDIIGGSKAIVNETVEVKNVYFTPIFIKKCVIVSAHIVEFTE